MPTTLDGPTHEAVVAAPPRSGLVFDVRGAGLLGAIIAAAWLLSPWALLFLAQVGGLIVIHEAGHLVVARRCGMATTEFFVGFGPTVVAWQRGETTWGVKALPLGGFVKIPGMSASEEVAPELEARTFRAASTPRRVVTALAGPGANLLAAVLIFTAAAIAMGGATTGAGDGPSSAVAAVVPALADGVELAIDTSTATVEGLASFVGEPFGTTTAADGAEVQNRFLSPVGASQVTEWTVEDDATTWLQFVGLISVSLAVANLLPVPPLDGGHAVVALTEGGLSRLRGRRTSIPKRVLTPLAWATVAFFAFLTVGSLVLDLTDPLENPLKPPPAGAAPGPPG